MYDDLKGKTVVVTGSSKGLGAAMARRFGAEGMNVVANYRSDEEGARETVRAIEEAGGAAAAVQADVSKNECVDALFDAAMFSFGGVDIWVNNAGIEVASPSDRKSIEEWQRVIDVNLTGVFAGCRRAIDHFLDRKMPGVIINAEKFADPEARAATERLIPMGYVGAPEDVAAAAAWLASDQASYVTGTTLFVDGGMTLYPGFQFGQG